MAIKDKGECWVKIKRTGFDFKVTEIRNADELKYVKENVKDKEGPNMKDHHYLTDELKTGKTITMTKNIDLSVVRIQKTKDVGTDKNKWCFVSGNYFQC